MKTFILILLIPIVTFCSNNTIKSTTVSNNLRIGHESSYTRDTLFFVYQNDTIIQSIQIFFVSEKISFSLFVENTKRNLKTEVNGFATKINSENAAMIVDQEEFAYFVDVYHYNLKDCWIYINIDNETFDKISVTVSDECLKEIHPFTPLSSIGLLEKV